MLKKTILYLWNSPTITSWASIFTRTVSLLIVLPLILNRFSASEIALWYLFGTVIGLQMLADFGFGPTFIRAIAYGMGGAEDLDGTGIAARKGTGPNWALIGRILKIMRLIYTRIAAIVFLLMITAGTVAVYRMVKIVPNPVEGWVAWGAIVCSSSLILFGNLYSSYLQGTNHVALLRRWEAIASLAGILTSFFVLLFDGSLLFLVLANQGWAVLNVLRNWYLCRKVEDGRFRSETAGSFDRNIFESIWPQAWRSGIGVLMGYGAFSATGILFAQFGEVGQVAMYLFAMRLIQTIAMFSQAPFYSKLPLYSKLFAEGKRNDLIPLLRTGMQRAHFTFVAGFACAGFFGPPFLKFIQSNIQFPEWRLWVLLGVGFFTERYGAMHINTYSLTNTIINHIANGVSGFLFILLGVALFPLIGMLAFPFAFVLSNLGFYSWYSAKHSFKVTKVDYFAFEKTAVTVPILLLLFSAFLIFILNN